MCLSGLDEKSPHGEHLCHRADPEDAPGVKLRGTPSLLALSAGAVYWYSNMNGCETFSSSFEVKSAMLNDVVFGVVVPYVLFGFRVDLIEGGSGVLQGRDDNLVFRK